MGVIRMLFLADSHLGIDQPAHPRVSRRRRGDDFMANYLKALQHAVDTECDAVIHGGDVFHRSQVRPELVQAAFVPLKRLAERGKPIFIVPGNHERSRIPHGFLALHPGIHIFDKPRTFVVHLHGCKIAIAGFPYAKSIRHAFPGLVRHALGNEPSAHLRLLCVHQCFEGAKVGPSDFTFRTAPDVVRHLDVPSSFSAVLSGHIHRRQTLRYDLRGQLLGTPVFYPGSIERTSFAEQDEPKGFLELTVDTGRRGIDRVRSVFQPLPARPMVTERIPADVPAPSLVSQLERIAATAPRDAIIRLRVEGPVGAAQAKMLSARKLRGLVGPTRNIEVRIVSNEQPKHRFGGIVADGARHSATRI